MTPSPSNAGARPWKPTRPAPLRRRLWVAAALLLPLAGCYVSNSPPPARGPLLNGREGRTVRLEVTGYCECGSCCGWKRNWRGRPVIASGPNRGKPKAVGVTASGTRVRPGTIAADTSVFPFGTMLYVPGYGYGRVEDRGRDIQGRHIDLYFRSHQQALVWGRKHVDVIVWR